MLKSNLFRISFALEGEDKDAFRIASDYLTITVIELEDVGLAPEMTITLEAASTFQADFTFSPNGPGQI